MESTSSPVTYHLPDLLSLYHLKGRTNPHHAQARKESIAWLGQYHLFSPKTQARLGRDKIELMAANIYPYASADKLRVCCDFLNIQFVLDEIIDYIDGEGAKAIGEVTLKSLANPSYENTSLLSQMLKDFSSRYKQNTGPSTFRRFIKRAEEALSSLSMEAVLRERDEVPDLETFTILRRHNSGTPLCLDMIEYIIDSDLPDEVYNHPTFMEAYWAVVDMVCVANDLYSYNMEQCTGHGGGNIISVLMKTREIDLQDACDFIGEYFLTLQERFLSAKAKMPSWGPDIDSQVSRFVEAAGQYVPGYMEWAFETERYFGTEGLDIKKSRTVTLSSSTPLESLTSYTTEEYASGEVIKVA